MNEDGKQKNQFSPRGRIKKSPLFVIVILILLPFINLAWFIPTYYSLLNSVSEAHLTRADFLGSETVLFLRGTLQALNDGAEIIAVERERAEREKVIARVFKNQQIFSELFLLDEKGKETFSLARYAGTSVPEEELFKRAALMEKALKGETASSNVYLSREFDPVITIAVPVVFAGKVTGVFGGTASIRPLNEIYFSLSSEKPGMRAYLADEDGYLLAHSDFSLVLKRRNVLERSLIRKALLNKERAVGLAEEDGYVNEENNFVFAVGVPLPNGWGVFVEMPRNIAFRQVYNLTALAILVTAAGVILLFFLWRSMRSLNLAMLEIDKTRIHAVSILQNLTDGLVEYTNDFRVMFMNRAAEAALGIRAEEIIGRVVRTADAQNPRLRSVVEVVYPALASFSKTVAQLPGNVIISEIKVSRPTEKNLQIITAPLRDIISGGIASFLKVIRDVSREKLIERSKSEFISIAAHQLRTPLSGVKWTLKLLLDGDFGQLSGEQKKAMREGYDANERMIRLIADLLDVARIEEGRFGYEFKKNNLLEVAQKTVEAEKTGAETKKVKIELTLPPDGMEEFVFDAGRVAMVFQNLLENAVNYNLPGGSVKVIISRNENFAEVAVRDTGIGVPRRELSRLFSKFFRGENVMRMQTEGSGLGLFIVRNIIRRHGGEIRVVSEENKGTTVWFRLPLDKSMIPPAEDVNSAA